MTFSLPLLPDLAALHCLAIDYFAAAGYDLD
jgi:hypothetical protein